MEIITFESKAYKELDNKITAIANFIFDQLDESRTREDEIWVDVMRFAPFFKSATVPCNAYGLMELLPIPILEGVVITR